MSVENGPSTEWDELRNFAESVRTGKDCFRDELTNPAAFKTIGECKRKACFEFVMLGRI
jgi:hypothetical protein